VKDLKPPKLIAPVGPDGAYIHQAYFDKWYADYIEPLFAGSIEVFRGKDAVKPMNSSHAEYEWSTNRLPSDTITGLIVGVRPIERGVTKEDVIASLRVASDMASSKFCDGEAKCWTELADRIEREGIKP
jgi:hypothetical protein